MGVIIPRIERPTMLRFILCITAQALGTAVFQAGDIVARLLFPDDHAAEQFKGRLGWSSFPVVTRDEGLAIFDRQIAGATAVGNLARVAAIQAARERFASASDQAFGYGMATAVGSTPAISALDLQEVTDANAELQQVNADLQNALATAQAECETLKSQLAATAGATSGGGPAARAGGDGFQPTLLLTDDLVGTKRAVLAQAGITTVQQLAEVDIESLVILDGIGRPTATKLIALAKEALAASE